MTKAKVRTLTRGKGLWSRLDFRVNRKHKDVLFRRVFRDRKDLLELYNALNGTTYNDPDSLEIVTMEDVIFMKMKNDLSLIVGSSLSLYEHRSTWNPNMPFRGLLYLARQYEGIVTSGGYDMYGKRRIELPTPSYVVFYNGNGMDEESATFYLSDSYPTGRGSGCLECICKVLNIASGHNRELMDKCRRLWEYSEFTSMIADNTQSGMSGDAAVLKAIDYCIDNNILKDILITERSEVMHMLLTEYDEKKHMRNLKEEGREEGRAEALKIMHTELAQKDAELTEKDTELTKKNAELLRKDTELARKDTELTKRNAEIADLKAQLAALKRSE